MRYTRETEQVRGIAFETWRYSRKCEYVSHNLRFDLDRRARAHTSQKLIIAPMPTRTIRSNGSKINRGVKGISRRVNERVFFMVSRVVKKAAFIDVRKSALTCTCPSNIIISARRYILSRWLRRASHTRSQQHDDKKKKREIRRNFPHR